MELKSASQASTKTTSWLLVHQHTDFSNWRTILTLPASKRNSTKKNNTSATTTRAIAGFKKASFLSELTRVTLSTVKETGSSKLWSIKRLKWTVLTSQQLKHTLKASSLEETKAKSTFMKGQTSQKHRLNWRHRYLRQTLSAQELLKLCCSNYKARKCAASICRIQKTRLSSQLKTNKS